MEQALSERQRFESGLYNLLALWIWISCLCFWTLVSLCEQWNSKTYILGRLHEMKKYSIFNTWLLLWSLIMCHYAISLTMSAATPLIKLMNSTDLSLIFCYSETRFPIIRFNPVLKFSRRMDSMLIILTIPYNNNTFPSWISIAVGQQRIPLIISK